MWEVGEPVLLCGLGPHFQKKPFSLGNGWNLQWGGCLWYLWRGEYPVNTDSRANDWLTLVEVRSWTHQELGVLYPSLDQ